MHGTIETTQAASDDTIIFSAIVDRVKTSPDAVIGRNGVTGGTTYTFNGVTLTDHSETPQGGSPFLSLDDQPGQFVVMHTIGDESWVEAHGGQESSAALGQMKTKLAL